jgi:hypothetical protein
MKQYKNKDYNYLYRSLSGEGFTKDQMTFETDCTYLTNTGFFSYRIENKYPRLVHFYIDKDKRSFKAAQELIREFRKILINKEYLFFIAEAPKEKPYMKRIIQYIKGKKYLEKNGDTFYNVPVFGRIT